MHAIYNDIEYLVLVKVSRYAYVFNKARTSSFEKKKHQNGIASKNHGKKGLTTKIL